MPALTFVYAFALANTAPVLQAPKALSMAPLSPSLISPALALGPDQDEESKVSPTTGAVTALRKHGIGLLSGLSMIPKGYVKGSMAAYALPRCTSAGPSDKAKAQGLLRAGNCAWYAGIQYIYRRSEHLDLIATAEYRKFAFPDGLWLKKKHWGEDCEEDEGNKGDCDLGMADYVEADFSHVYLGGEAIGYATLIKKPRWLVQLGGGGGVGLVIFTGKRLMQTPIGRGANGRPGSADGDTCESIEDFDDFTKCQPQWWDDPDTDQDGDGERDNDELDNKKLKKQDGFVDCDENGCDHEDLARIGSRRQTFAPPVLALPKLVASARVLFDQSYGLNLRGGFNGGLFMGASFQYFFGKKK